MGILSAFGAFTAMQFEKQDDGYLYRANGKGPARPVTQQEFDRFVRQGGVSFLLHLVAFMLAVIAAAMLTATWFPEGGEAGGFLLMGGMLLGIGFALYRSIHWAMLAPERALAGRKPVAAPKPGYYEQRKPRPIPASPTLQREPGLWTALRYTLAELVGGLAVTLLAARLLSALLDTNGEFSQIAMVGGLIAGGVVVFLIERRCRRKYGSGPLDMLHHLHF